MVSTITITQQRRHYHNIHNDYTVNNDDANDRNDSITTNSNKD